MYGFGGEGLTFFSAARHMGRCTQPRHCTVQPFLFRITVIVSIPFFRQGRDPIRADIPLFVDRDIFLQFLPIHQPPCLHWHPTLVKGHGPQAIGCEVHVSLFEQPHLRVVLLPAFLLGLFIGLKGLLMAAAALVLATDSTTNFDILK